MRQRQQKQTDADRQQKITKYELKHQSLIFCSEINGQQLPKKIIIYSEPGTEKIGNTRTGKERKTAEKQEPCLFEYNK